MVGNTDPATAAEKSLRGIFYKSWAEPWPQLTASRLSGRGPSLRLGLPSQPHVGENAVHGSASPFEVRSDASHPSPVSPSPSPLHEPGLGGEVELARGGLRERPLWLPAARTRPGKKEARGEGARRTLQPRRDLRFYREMEEKPGGRKPSCPTWESSATWCRM